MVNDIVYSIICNSRYAMRFLQSRKDDFSFINTVCPEDYFDANGQKIYFFTSIFKGWYHLLTITPKITFFELLTKCDASFRWSFRPHSAWDSKKSRTIVTTDASLKSFFPSWIDPMMTYKKVIPHLTKSSTSNVQVIVRFYLIMVNVILNVIFSLVDMMMAIATVSNIKIGLLTIIKIQENIFINQLILRIFYSNENLI